MAGKLSKDTEAYKNKLAYIKEHNHKCKKIQIYFNPNTEQDLIDWLNGRAKATYIKSLIRKDMNQSGD